MNLPLHKEESKLVGHHRMNIEAAEREDQIGSNADDAQRPYTRPRLTPYVAMRLMLPPANATACHHTALWPPAFESA